MDLMNYALGTVKAAQYLALNTQPYPRPHQDPNKLLMMNKLNANEAARNDEENIFNTKTQCVSADMKCSLKGVDDLRTMRTINLREMMVNHIHKDCYLICRIIGESYYITGITTLVEDTDGEVEQLQLYNYSRSYKEPANKLLPIGTILYIIEPFLKLSGRGNGLFWLHVDSPSDIVLPLIENIEISSSSLPNHFQEFSEDNQNDLKERGNQYFKEKQYEDAIRLYSASLTKGKNAQILANRAAAFLALDRFYPAFQDADESLKLDPSYDKSHYRRGKAAYGMRQWTLSIESFQQCLRIDPRNNVAKQELERAKMRQIEKTTGSYNLIDIFNKFHNDGQIRFDLADYQSPHIAVVELKHDYKGVVALTDIPKGSLLVYSKAVVSTKEEEATAEGVKINFDPTMQVTMSCYKLVRSELIYAIRFNPHLANEIYSLYAGESFSRPFKTIQDTHVLVDVTRLDAIFVKNGFSSNVLDSGCFEKVNNCGLWILPSFFNHKCLPNSVRLFFGDIMFVFALRDICKGEEITHEYVNVASEYDERQATFQAYGFQCACELCLYEKDDIQRVKRNSMMTDFRNNFKVNSVEYVKPWVDKLWRTFADRPKFQIAMEESLMLLAGAYKKDGDFEKARHVLTKLYKILKTDYGGIRCVDVALHLSNVQSSPRERVKWLKIAQNDNCVGDEAFFRHRYRSAFM